MKFDKPAGVSPLDKGDVLGKSTQRIEGPLKVSGKATYAYEWHDVLPNQAYGYIVGAAIATGRIASMHLAAAKAAPGVIGIVTADNAGKLGKGLETAAPLLGGPEIAHYHQAIALVVAETFEQARAAALLIRVDYDRKDGAYDLAAAKDKAFKPEKITGGLPDSDIGDFAGAYAATPIKIDENYSTGRNTHAMMEPHATLAHWEGDKLTCWTSNQMIDWSRGSLAGILGIPKEDIRLISPYIGGGFGGKLFIRADAVMAALGSRLTGRPVKVSLQRTFMYNNTPHRSSTLQRIRIAATKEGKITAIGHENWSSDIPGGTRAETGVRASRIAYAGANRMTRTRVAALDLPEATAMRAPSDASGSITLEIAMDEMAEKLGIDPIEFRTLNDTVNLPEQPGRHFTQRKLVECLRTGADAFGWSKRNPKPRSVRDGHWHVGIGVASAVRNGPATKSAARIRLNVKGVVTVETDMTDIGTGSYTIIGQTAAEMMGVPLNKVVVRLGDSNFPISSGSGGQWGAASSTAGVYAACTKLREAVAQKLGLDPATATFANGKVMAGGKSILLAKAAADQDLVVEDFIEFGVLDKENVSFAFGAHFVEVGVDAYTAEVRLRRMLCVVNAGRIFNPLSARSQIIGGMTMGAGAALTEELVVDPRFGYFVNHDMAQYEVPVHADVPHQEVIFIEDTDPLCGPMKGRGVGELGICGIGAAIANAVYNATGVRIRDYPITIDKLLPKLVEHG